MHAEVWLGTVRVGSLEKFEDETLFRFDSDYERLPDRPVLGQLFEDRFPDDVRTHGLVPWFRELLPQGPLRRAIAREAALEADDDFGMLVWLGADLPGAVRVTAKSPPPHRPSLNAPHAASGSAVLRASLAGVQWKVALSRMDSRLTLPLRGEEAEWIAKFQSTELPRLVQVEYATMCWARASGLDVPEIELIDATDINLLPPSIPVGDGKVLLVRRFDRTPTRRVHFEDFAQILDRPDQYGGAYEEIARFVCSECPDDIAEFIRRIAFMICSGNADAHLKNWAIIYPEGKRGRLSPTYDQVATLVFPQLPAKLALRLNGEADATIVALRAETLGPLATALKLENEDLRERLVAAMRKVVDAFVSVSNLWSDYELKALRRHHGGLKLLAR